MQHPQLASKNHFPFTEMFNFLTSKILETTRLARTAVYDCKEELMIKLCCWRTLFCSWVILSLLNWPPKKLSCDACLTSYCHFRNRHFISISSNSTHVGKHWHVAGSWSMTVCRSCLPNRLAHIIMKQVTVLLCTVTLCGRKSRWVTPFESYDIASWQICLNIWTVDIPWDVIPFWQVTVRSRNVFPSS
jgi:hypothetical protein